MSWTQWVEKQSLRVNLLSLGQKLTALKADYAHVSDRSSRMVGQRLNRALSDYWRACKSYEKENFELVDRLLEAATIEADFLRALLDAECAERELGESDYFEFGDKLDDAVALARLERGFEAVELELQALASESRRRM